MLQVRGYDGVGTIHFSEDMELLSQAIHRNEVPNLWVRAIVASTLLLFLGVQRDLVLSHLIMVVVYELRTLPKSVPESIVFMLCSFL